MFKLHKFLPCELRSTSSRFINLSKTSKDLTFYSKMCFANNDPRVKIKTSAQTLQEEDSKTTKILKFAVAIVLGLSASYYSFAPKNDRSKSNPKKINTQTDEEEVPEPKVKDLTAEIGGDWKLLDINGKPFSQENLKGHNYLLYFGFCNCPDVCPESLHKITDAIKLLKKRGVYEKVNLKTVFVSLDPDRDNKEKMEQFLKLFDPDIIGLRGKTNEDPELKDMMKKYRIFCHKLELDGKPDSKGNKPYTYDHTIITYLMSDKNKCLRHFSPTMDGDDIANEIVRAIIEGKKTF